MNRIRPHYFLYKCRLCGKVFVEGESMCRKGDALKMMTSFIIGNSIEDRVLKGDALATHTIHTCDDNISLGYSDFVGVTTSVDTTPLKVSLETLAEK